MIVTTKEILLDAKKGNYAIPAPNFFDFNSAADYVEIAEKKQKPLILAFAQGHIQYLALEDAAMIGRYLAKKATIPVALHLDHGTDEKIIKQAIDIGFTSVMIDASEDDFPTNVAKTQAIVDYAKLQGVSVEAEIGHVGSEDSQEHSKATTSIYTETRQAAAFARKTGVDSLAVSIGTAHGFYQRTPEINFDCLHEIAENVSVPLVLHGGSSSGEDNLHRCATEGIAKINLFTDLFNAGMEQIKLDCPQDLFALQASRRKGMQKMLAHYYQVFATKNWR